MKRLFFILSLGLATMLAGCNNENDGGASPGESKTVCFHAGLPGTPTRVGGTNPDGYTPSRYIMEIYEGTMPAQKDSMTHIEQSSGTFNVPLTDNKTYTCLFWADNGTPDGNADNDDYHAADLKAVSIRVQTECPAYGGARQIAVGDYTDKGNYNITLQHAVAKANFVQTEVFTGVDNTLNVTFPKSYRLNVADRSTTETASATTCQWRVTGTDFKDRAVGTAYLIMPDARADLQNITFRLNGEPERAVSNVPLQRNHTTNISGAFSNFYGANINSSLGEWDADKEDNLVSAWDGTSILQPAGYNPNTPGTVYITSAAELAWIAKNNDKKHLFSGYTFKLTRDIDLKNHSWTPIGFTSNFEGVFDGNGFTVRGLNATGNGDSYVLGFGFLCSLYGSTAAVRNLTVYGEVTYSGNKYAGGIVGCAMSGATIENCVNHCKVGVSAEANAIVGGIVGDLDNATVRNCTNYGVVENKDDAGCKAGGIVGVGESKSTIEGCINAGKVTSGGRVGGIGGEIANNNSDPSSLTLMNNRSNKEVRLKSSDPRYYLGYIIGSALAHSSTVQADIVLTNNRIDNGTDADVIIGLCSIATGPEPCGKITVDGIRITANYESYPVPTNHP